MLEPQNRITSEPGYETRRLKYYRATETDPAYWDALWASIDTGGYARERRGHLPRFLAAPVAKYLTPGARVLEAGCGLGGFTVAMKARGFDAEGCDYAPQVVAKLTDRFPEIRFFVADVRRMKDTPDGAYDAVYSPGVVEHFEAGPEPILAETWRILKPGGVALVSTPCLNGFRRRLARRGAFPAPPAGIFYQYAFAPEEMATILRGVGFVVEEVGLRGTLKTLADHTAVGRVRFGPLLKPVAVALDLLPVTRHWGHSALWVARKPA